MQGAKEKQESTSSSKKRKEISKKSEGIGITTVEGIKRNAIILNKGSKDGIKIGLTGKIYYEVTIKDEKKPIYIAKFVIIKVNQKSSEAKIIEKTEDIKLGFLIQFDEI